MHNTPRSWNFLPKAILVVALGLATVGTSVLADVVTDPVGFITLQATTGPNRISFWGLSMTMLPEQKGSATIISNSVTDASAAFTANQWNSSTAKPYELEITSGPLAGVFSTVAGTEAPGTVYTADSITNDSITASYLIRPIWTLRSAFGDVATANGFQGGTSGPVADNVSVWNPNAVPQTYVTYYYKTNSGGGGSGWRSGGNTGANRGDIPLYIDQGIQILRRAASGNNVLLVGAVKLGQTSSPIVGNNKLTYAANVYPYAFTLNNSGLKTSSSATGVQGGTSGPVADNVSIWNASASPQTYVTYYYKTNSGGGGSGWRSGGNTGANRGDDVVPLGGTTQILRRGANGFYWIMPQPFVN